MVRVISFFKKPYSPFLFLVIIIMGIYYKFFLLGKIPFPGDLLIGSYFPWLDYFKMPVQNPLISDVFSQFFLWKYLAIDSFKNLQWPLWNPHSFSGTPLLATYHSATLYPLNILLFFPKYFGWGLFIFSQNAIAAISMYLFLGIFTKHALARMTGSIIFTFGGLMTTWLQLGTAAHAMAWLPLCLYSINKFSETEKFRFILILIISLSLIVLAGNAQITTYSYITAVFYSLHINCINWKRGLNIGKAILLFFAILISLLLTSLQLLPSYDLFQKSIRQSESYTTESNYGLMSIRDPFKFFIADYFGNPVTRNYWGNLNYSETSGFLGILSLPLLIYAFFKLRTRQSLFFFILLGTSLLFAFDNPISRFFYQIKIPLLSSSYASRILFMSLLSVSVLSALSVNHILKNEQVRAFGTRGAFGTKSFDFFLKVILWSWAAILGIILGTLLTHFFIWDIIGWAPSEKYLKVYLESRDYDLKNFSVALKNTFVPFGILSIFLIISFLLNRRDGIYFKKNTLNVIFFVLLSLITLDLGRYFLKFNPFVAQNLIFPSTPAIEFLKNQKEPFRLGREHAEVLPPNTWTAYNLHSIEGYDPLYLNRYGKFIYYLNGGDIRYGNSTRYAELSSRYDSPFIDAANVKYFIGVGRDKNGYTPGDLINYHFNEAGYKRVFNDKSAVILENPRALPRVYFASSFKVVNESILENIIMTDSTFDPRTTVLLERNLKIATTSGKGQASIVSYSPNIVKIETKTENPEILILADQYDEGWKAKIDGEQTLVSPANYIFRAVKVPEGTHKVTFYYSPKSFELGIKISAISFLIFLAVTLVSIRKKTF